MYLTSKQYVVTGAGTNQVSHLADEGDSELKRSNHRGSFHVLYLMEEAFALLFAMILSY